MLKIAHIEDDKIVNISLHEKMPKGKGLLDLSDYPGADIGDAVVGKLIISQYAVKDLKQAKELCLARARYDFNAMHQQSILEFNVSSLPELYTLYSLMGDSPVITLQNDAGKSVQVHRSNFLTILQGLYDLKQKMHQQYYQQCQDIDNAKSVRTLSAQFPSLLPAHTVHPEAK